MSKSECRYPLKRLFETKQKAIEDAKAIKRMVEQRGDTYSQLYPYKCPDGEHWHLTSQAPPVIEISDDDTDPAVQAAERAFELSPRSQRADMESAAREMARPIRELIEHAENHGDFIAIDDLKKLVYAEWELG